jgi:hypothetical protein
VATAETLTERMDALERALRDAGVAPDRIASILSSAATATMHALVLDAVLEGNAHVPAEPVQQPAPDEQPLKVAA